MSMNYIVSTTVSLVYISDVALVGFDNSEYRFMRSDGLIISRMPADKIISLSVDTGDDEQDAKNFERLAQLMAMQATAQARTNSLVARAVLEGATREPAP